MNIKGFIRRHWNRLTDTISNYLNFAAEKTDASLNTHYPLSRRFFRRIGVTPQNILHGVRGSVNYLSDRGKNVLDGIRSAGKGFLEVAITFVPFIPSRTSIWSVMLHTDLRKDLFRAMRRDIVFIVSANALLKWPELFNQYLIRKKEERELPFGLTFYSLFGLNIIMIYKFYQYKKLISHFKHYVIQDMIDTAVINDRVSKLEIDHSMNTELKRLSEKSSMTILDPRPEAIKEFARTKIFRTLESTIKDNLVITTLILNQLLFGSRLITALGWLARARIIGKDLGTNQLAATGISNVHLRRIQGHRNFQFLGEGAAYLAVDELARTLFYLFTGLHNTSGYNFPINVALSCLAYKLSSLAAYIKRVDLKAADWEEEGINLDTFYRPVFVDPMINWGATKIEKRLKKNTDFSNPEGPLEKKSRQEDFALQAQLKDKEALFWENLLKHKLTKAERAFLQLHADNLIFFLSTFKQSRASGAEYCFKFLALLFPKRIQDIMKTGLEELTDDRIDKMIKFLLINKKSSLVKDGKKADDKWIAVEDEKLSKKPNTIYDEAEEELEIFDITPKEIDAIHYTVAKTLKCHNSGIIDVRIIDEQEHPDPVFRAEVDHQYDSVTDANEARDVISPIQSPINALCETFSSPVRQFIHSYRMARYSGMNRTRIIVQGVADGVSAMSDGIDKHLGGKKTLQAATLASSFMGGPVTAAIGITAAVAQTVAEHAPSIQTGAAMVGNIVDGLNTAHDHPNDAEQKPDHEPRDSHSIETRDSHPMEQRASLQADAQQESKSLAEDLVAVSLLERKSLDEYTQQSMHSEPPNAVDQTPYVTQFQHYISGTASYYWSKMFDSETPLSPSALSPSDKPHAS